MEANKRKTKKIEATQPPVKLTPLKGHDQRHDKPPGKQRSKFVLKAPQTPLPLPPDIAKKLSKNELLNRKGVRYSEAHGRYSFDVVVKGPFVHKMDPSLPPPEMKEVGTQAMILEEDEYDDNSRFSLTSAEHEEDAGGDASSSTHSEIVEKGKTLERKPSKRREAETMARPRGYKDLDLKEEMPSLSFEFGTQVSSEDIEKKEAERKGIIIPKDNILWPSCKDFRKGSASKKIEDYIKRYWKIDPKWMYVIQTLEEYQDHFKKRHVFEVKFSVPSATTPIPFATASVFFTFEIPIYSSPHDQVSVTYVLEGTRFAHKPGKIPFQDKWLWGIISDKLRIQKAVNF